YMAGSAGTDPDGMFTGFLVPELRIKGGNTSDLGRGYLSDLTNSFQCLFGEVMKFILNGLKDGDDGFDGGSVVRHDPVNNGIEILIR
ncbi:MAG: hypothetical protein WCL00_13050, partial [Bacteroidota bacterium]